MYLPLSTVRKSNYPFNIFLSCHHFRYFFAITLFFSFTSESSLESDSTNGTTACTKCGVILQENVIVSEINFQENASGTASVVGQFVPSSGPKALSSAGRGMPMGHSRASREITLQMAKRRILGIASQLNVPQVVSEAAHNIYHLAAQVNFTSGRRQNTVYAACLYVSCRRHKTSHMLVDFAQFMNASVFVLGGAVLKLSQVLNMKLPIIDPSLYMHRFAADMELGSQAFPVANTAIRLLAHMRRDWMHTGRRPSGICGACLLLAARMHNFARTPKEVAQVVRIGEGVLRQRLGEFSNSSSAGLTVAAVEELSILDDPTQMIAEGASLAPPSFQRLQIRSEKIRRLRQLLEKTPDLATLLAPQSGVDPAVMNVNDRSDASLEEIVKQIDRALRASPVLDEIYNDLEMASTQGDVALLESKAPAQASESENQSSSSTSLVEKDSSSTFQITLLCKRKSATLVLQVESILLSFVFLPCLIILRNLFALIFSSFVLFFSFLQVLRWLLRSLVSLPVQLY